MHIPGRSLFTLSPKNLARPTGFGWIFDIFFRKHACWHRRFRIENRLLLRGITAAWSYGMLESQLAILAAVKAPAHFLTVLASTSEILLRNGIFGWFSHMLYRIGPRFQKCVRIWSRALQKKVTAVGRYVIFSLFKCTYMGAQVQPIFNQEAAMFFKVLFWEKYQKFGQIRLVYLAKFSGDSVKRVLPGMRS